MEINQKNIFWEALIISLFILGIGFLLGTFLENHRSNESIKLYLATESQLLDIQIFSDLIENSHNSCNTLIMKNIEFGDKVYRDAKLIEKYEEAKKITSEITDQHKKYTLLRTLFWLNSIKIKEKCNNFSTVIYFYEYEPKDLYLESQQAIFSRYLFELKEDFGKEIVLIPLATNLDLASLELLNNQYNLNSFGILIDEKLFINKSENLQEIRTYLDKLYHNKP
jgi:hypothetical protein